MEIYPMGEAGRESKGKRAVLVVVKHIVEPHRSRASSLEPRLLLTRVPIVIYYVVWHMHAR